MRKTRFNAATLLVIALSLFAILVAPTMSFAGSGVGMSGGYGKSGRGPKAYWVRAESSSYDVFARYGNMEGASYGSSAARRTEMFTPRQYAQLPGNGWTGDSRLAAWVVTPSSYRNTGTKSNGQFFLYNYTGGSTLRNINQWSDPYNWTHPGNGSSNWPANWVTELSDSSLTNTRVSRVGKVLIDANRPNNDFLCLIWIDPAKEWVPEEKLEKRTKLIFVQEDDEDPHFSYKTQTQEDLIDIYENAPTSDNYYHKTQPKDTTDTHRVRAKVITVVKHTTYKVRKSDGATKDENIFYTSEDLKSFDKTINYQAKTPTINQEKFTPYNLNRNSTATSQDIDSSWVEKTPLSVTLNNNQGITNNKAIESLDINNDTQFVFKFDNGSLGMPGSYNWNNTPASLANGDWEDVNRGGAYANGRNNAADSDGLFRHNLKFNASITSADAGIDTASILYGDEEVKASEIMTKTSGFHGGDWSARFVYLGKYNTDNNGVSDEFKKWWVNSYQESRFFEYGTEYWGSIDTSGIHNPHTITCGTGSAEGDNYKITTDSDRQERGLYVGMKTSNFVQPVLYAHWNIRTLAGDIN